MSIFQIPSHPTRSRGEFSGTVGVSCRLVTFLLAALLLSRPLQGVEPAGSATVLEDFEGTAPTKAATLWHWRWTAEEKELVARTSSLMREILPGAAQHGIRVRVTAPLPRSPEWITIWNTRADYLPPEATAVRFRAKVVGGSFTLTCGSATAYFACSDVWAKPVTLREGDWTTVELSLVQGLERNFRRAIFSSESPVIQYTRWIQEPLRLMLESSSQGELWIDEIVLVRSTQPPATESHATVRSTADLSQAFTFATDAREFDLARDATTEALRKPALLEWPAGGAALKIRQRGLEEMSFAALPLTAPTNSNAFRIHGRFVHESNAPFVVVDFLALVAPEGLPHWAIPPHAAKGFDLCLTPEGTRGMSWGFYHTRRRVPNNQPVTLDLPFCDFLCAYGQEDLRQAHQLLHPLNPAEIVALALASPFGQRSADTVFLIDTLEVVSLNPSPVQTYPQPLVPHAKK